MYVRKLALFLGAALLSATSRIIMSHLGFCSRRTFSFARAGLIGAALAAFGGHEQALASVGCSAMNGTLNSGNAIITGGFAIGDVITINASSVNPLDRVGLGDETTLAVLVSEAATGTMLRRR